MLKKLIVIFIDYFATINIAKQIKLFFSFLDCINLRFICIF